MKSPLLSGFYLRNWLIEPDQARLSSETGDTHLPPRVMAVLVLLADHAGEVVTRDQFGDAIWAPAVVTDDALTRCIAELRRALGDSKSEPRYIETVPKLGYRLLTEVTSKESAKPTGTVVASDLAYRHNLPTYRSTFIGREQDLERIVSLLRARSLVTLTGPGGTGKTRLSLAVAYQLLADFSEQVFFVDLSSVQEQSMIPHAIAIAIDLPLGGPKEDAAQTAIIQFLSSHRALLLIDNCEHLIDGAARLIDEVLTACKGTTILATSREALAIEGEQVFKVQPLSVLESGEPSLGAEAILLFTDRASSANSAFHADSSNLPQIAELCRQLDGIPLAIELAAARVSHLSLSDISTRLNERFALLTVGTRRRTPRHQTLQAAVDWSYALLEEPEQALLARLSVFSGGFTLAAAESICMPERGDNTISVDLLSALVDKSLVVAEQLESITRYRLLETIRLYALDRLTESGKVDIFRQRHWEWFLSTAEAYPVDERACRFDIAEPLAREIANYRTALIWSKEHQHLNKTARMAAALVGVWCFSGHHKEGYDLTCELAENPDICMEQRAQCRAVAAYAAMIDGNWPAVGPLAQQAMADDPDGAMWGLAAALSATVAAAVPIFREEARSSLMRIQGHPLSAEQPWLRRQCTAALLHIDVIDGHAERALINTQQQINGVITASTCDIYVGMAVCVAALITGKPEIAQKHAAAMVRSVNNSNWNTSRHFLIEGHLLAAMAEAELAKFETARKELFAAARYLVDRPWPLYDGECAIGFAVLHTAEGNFVRAGELLECIAPTSQDSQVRRFRWLTSFALIKHYRERALESLTDDAVEQIKYSARSMRMDTVLQQEVAMLNEST